MYNLNDLKNTRVEALPPPLNREKGVVATLREFSVKQYMADSCSFYKKNPSKLSIEVLSGITVVLMQIPDSVAFSFVANVEPLVGLYATFFMGFITAVIGGTPGMISGAAGAMAVVAKDLMTDDGALKQYTKAERLEQHLMCVVLIGAFQLLCGVFQLANTIKLIPTSAMIGFLNGLGAIIFISQFKVYQACTDQTIKLYMNCPADKLQYMGLSQAETWITLGYIAMTMSIIHFLPKIKNKWIKMVPAAMVAIIIGTILEQGLFRPVLDIKTRTVQETAKISGDFPTIHVPQLPASPDWGVIIQYAVVLCLVGLIESVMTLEAVDILTKRTPTQFKANQECIAQGLANFVCGWCRAMGGDAMIGQSTINIKNGAEGRLSGIVAGWGMLVVIMFAYKGIGLIPIGTLTGALYMVVVNTFYFRSLILILRRQIPILDSVIIVVVTVLSILTNLAIGVIVGVIINALAFAYQTTQLFSMQVDMVSNGQGQQLKHYKCIGDLYFGCQRAFINMFAITTDPSLVLIDFSQSTVKDLSAIQALQGIFLRYHDANKQVFVVNLDPFSTDRLKKASVLAKNVKFIDTSLLDKFQEENIAETILNSSRHEEQDKKEGVVIDTKHDDQDQLVSRPQNERLPPLEIQQNNYVPEP